jgi:transcriptional regulator of acetoin/glycerol metabolism
MTGCEPDVSVGCVPPFCPAAAPDSLDILTLDEVQRRHIRKVLKKTGGAADIQGIKRSTLYSRMEKLGVKVR